MWPFKRGRRRGAAGIPIPEHWGPAYKALWDRYVPASGQADTVQGELIRAAARVRSECHRNGMLNWPESRAQFEAFCRFVREHLEDGTLPAQASEFVRATMQSTIDMGRWLERQWAREEEAEAAGAEAEENAGDDPNDPRPDFAEADLLEIECLVELWCEAHPEPIPRPVSEDAWGGGLEGCKG